MARIRELRFAVLAIPFKVAFRHASAERAETSSVWVESVSEGGVVGRGESCPRPYVTGETIESAQAFFSRHEAALSRTRGRSRLAPRVDGRTARRAGREPGGLVRHRARDSGDAGH